MRVMLFTSVLSHKGRGCRCPKLNDTLSLEVKELTKHALRVKTGLLDRRSQLLITPCRSKIRASSAMPSELVWAVG